MIITIPDDDSEVDGSTKTASKDEAPASLSMDSSMCQSNGNNTKKNGSNPDQATATAARDHSTCSRSMPVDGVPSDQTALNTESRSRSETHHVPQKSNSAHFDGMSLRSNLVAQQGLMVDLKAQSCSLSTIPYIRCL